MLKSWSSWGDLERKFMQQKYENGVVSHNRVEFIENRMYALLTVDIHCFVNQLMV